MVAAVGTVVYASAIPMSAAVRTRVSEVAVPVRPASHFTWQVLRRVKRGKKPPTGRSLRPASSRKTRYGSFLTTLVQEGLLARVTGSAHAPVEATYALTERGKFAAEYDAAKYELKPRGIEPQVAADAVPPKMQTLR